MVHTKQSTSQETGASYQGHQDLAAASIDSNSPDLARPLAMGSGNLTLAGKKEAFDYEIKQPVDGVSELNITSPLGRMSSRVAEMFAGVGAAVSHFVREHFKTAATAGTAGLGLFLGTADNANATLMLSGSPDAGYKSLGEQYAAQAMWLHGTLNGFPYYASAVRLNDEYALTAAHTIIFSNGTGLIDSLGNGTNYLTAPGSTVGVDSVMVHPSYNGTLSTPDLAIIHFSHKLAGLDVDYGESVTPGEILTSVGYGTYGTPDSGLFVSDGNARGFVAPVFNSAPIDAASEYYFSTIFGSSTNLEMNGKGTSGDSGGPIFDSLRQSGWNQHCADRQHQHGRIHRRSATRQSTIGVMDRNKYFGPGAE